MPYTKNEMSVYDTHTRLRNYESVGYRRTSCLKCMSIECTQNLSNLFVEEFYYFIYKVNLNFADI